MKAHSSAAIGTGTALRARVPRALILAGLLALGGAGCGEVATVPESVGFGPQPILPEPHPTLIPPFGMALAGNDLYVANTDAVMRFPYHARDTSITAPGVKLVDLPAGEINHHWTKDLIASRDGAHLYVTVGSNGNIPSHGMEKEAGRAARCWLPTMSATSCGA